MLMFYQITLLFLGIMLLISGIGEENNFKSIQAQVVGCFLLTLFMISAML